MMTNRPYSPAEGRLPFSHSFVYLLESVVNMAHFNNIYVRFPPGPTVRFGASDLERHEHKHC